MQALRSGLRHLPLLAAVSESGVSGVWGGAVLHSAGLSYSAWAV